MKNNKGITLIALVITIIVMLILVTVTIQVATNGNLFTHAGNAAKETKKAAAEENALAGGTVGDKSIEEIVAEQTGTGTTTPEVTLIHFTVEGYDVTYTAEDGMTWGAWLDDERFDGATFSASANGMTVLAPNGLHVVTTVGTGYGVLLTDSIIDGNIYGVSDAIK